MNKSPKLKILFEIFHYIIWTKQPKSLVDGFFSFVEISKKIDPKHLKVFELLFFVALIIFSFNLGFLAVGSAPEKLYPISIATIGSICLFLFIIKKLSGKKPPKGNEKEYRIVKIFTLITAFTLFFYLLASAVK